MKQERALRILYVDDDAPARRAFEDAAGDRDGFAVEATDEPDRVSDLVANGVDCVVCTHRESGVDGLACLESLRTDYPDVPFVLAPVVGDERLAARALDAGATGYVPSDEEDWHATIFQRVSDAVDRTPGYPVGQSLRMPIKDLGIKEELRLKERAMDAAPIGITISDPDQADNPLIYVNDAFERLTGYPLTEAVGRNCRYLQGEETDPDAVTELREGIDAAEPVSVELINYRKDGEQFWNKVDIAPIRDELGNVTNYVGFQTDITKRKEAEFEVKRERRNLEHLVNRVNGLIQDVTRDLVQSTSRADVARAICDRVASVDVYEFAWLGEPNLADDTLVPAAWAGRWDPDEADLGVDLTADDAADSPAAKAHDTREVQTVSDPDELRSFLAEQSWLDPDEVGGVAAIPLLYRDTLYGVLTVLVSSPDSLNERELVVLEALSRAGATAINAVERGRILVADNVVELEFDIGDPELFFVTVSAQTGTDLEYEGSVTQSDGSVVMFFTTTASPEEVYEAVEDAPSVSAATVVHEGEDANLYEFTVGPDSIVALLAEHGARTRSIAVSGGRARVEVELPNEADARFIVEQLRDRYRDTDLVAYRERERPPTTKQEFITDLKSRLTDRQLTALQTAYLSGFYDWNRPVSGDDLAASMGVSRSTFHQHLRAAERKLVEEVFDT